MLTTGSVLAAAATIWCLVTAVRTPGPATMSTDPRARRIWWAALLVEAVAITAGAVLLARTGGQHWLSSWALAVVSLHFLPLARAFRLGVLTAVTVAGLAAAAAAVAAQLSGVLPAGTVAGLGGGVVLLLGGLVARATR